MKNIGKSIIMLTVALALLFGVAYYKDNSSYVKYIKQNKIIMADSEEKFSTSFKVNKLQREKSYFYYNLLNENEKNIYEKMALTVKGLDNAFVIEKSEYKGANFSESLAKVVNYFINDHPEVFYLNSKYKYNEYSSLFIKQYIVKLEYSVATKEELNTKIEEVEKEINKALQVANFSTDYENEIALHDYIGTIVRYDYNKENSNLHNIYGTLVEKKAVCDGLTKTLNMLLDKKGIETILITGVLENQPHAWTIAKINGDYYQVDLTANISLDKVENVVIHTYFNRSTDEMVKTHKIDDLDKMPKCTATKENYYVKNNAIIKASDNFSDKLNNILNNSKSKKLIEFKVEDKNDVSKKLGDTLSYRNEYKNKRKFSYYEVYDTIIIKNT